MVIASTAAAIVMGPLKRLSTATVAKLAPGPHAITARFDSDDTVLYENAVSSPPRTLIIRNPTTLGLSFSAPKVVYAQPVTLTATVPAGAAGFVTFGYVVSGGSVKLLGTAGTVGAQAQLTLSGANPIPVGINTFTATFYGDPKFTSVSTQATLQVDFAIVSLTIVSPQLGASIVPGQAVSVQVQASVNPPSLANALGTVRFHNNETTFATAALTLMGSGGLGQASATLTNPVAGQNVISVDYSGATDSNGNPALVYTVSPTVTVNEKGPASISVTASLNPVSWGTSEVLTVQLPAAAAGSVTFYDPLNFPAGTVAPLVNGVAKLALTNLRVGTHSITVGYAGDSTYSASSSAALTLTVTPSPTSTTLVSPTASSSFVPGQSVTLSARVQPIGEAAALSGSVRFSDTGTTVGTATVSGGVATMTLPNLAAGSHSFIATFTASPDAQGDTDFATSSSSAVAFSTSKQSLSALVTFAPATPAYGDMVTLTAVLGSPAVTGQVTFQDGSAAIGTATLNGGQATLQTQSLAVGSHRITAAYGGDANWAPAAVSVTLPVGQAASATTVKTALSASGSATVVAQVARATAGSGAPTGSVQFVDAVTRAALGAGTLASGTGSTPVAATSVMRPIEAVYAGDGNFAASTSAATLALVNAASYASTALAPDSLASIFGVAGMSGDATATLPLPATLGGVSASITDSSGATLAAPLSGVFAPAGQINFLMPSGVAPGLGVLTINGAGASISGVINAANLAPALFTANASGTGVAAATYVRVTADNVVSTGDVAAYDATQKLWVPLAIDLGAASDQVVLVLYGTGFRHGAAGAATVTVNGVNAAVQYAGAQSQYPGLDQLNVLLPHSLAGAGTVTAAAFGGQAANPVMIAIQ